MTDDPQMSTPPPAPDDPETVAYTPEPERRPEWARAAWLDPAPGEPAAATEPAAGTEEVRPAEPASSSGGLGGQPPRRVGLGSIVAASVLSAALASGGTVALLETTGALVRPAPASTGAVGNVPTSGTIVIDDSSAVVNAAAKVSPAVVRITATGVSSNVFGGTLPETGVGSGVIYDPDGWILTNKHVVLTSGGAIASELTVELKDGRSFTGTVYGIDTLTDLAIVKVDTTGLPAAPIGASADIKVGQLAIAIGSPLGTYTNSVTTGIISATGRSIDIDATTRLSNLIQTDAAINPGNSGGPLLDATGAVIGINTAIERDSNGIGFAIPIDIARPIMAQALAGQTLSRPYIGIRFQPINVQLQQAKDLPVDKGALIGPGQSADGAAAPGITPGSPAEAAGLQEGDIIVELEGTVIDAEHPLEAVLTSYGPGQTVTLAVLRGGQRLEVKVTLGTRPEQP